MSTWEDSGPLMETWADDDEMAEYVPMLEALEPGRVHGSGWAADVAGAAEWREQNAAYAGRRGAAAQRAECERRNVPKSPWRGVFGFDDVESAAFRTLELGPGCSDRLRAYVERLSAGPVRTWAWYLAWVASTPGTMRRFSDPDQGDGHVWPAGSRRSPQDVARRVERYRKDRRPAA